jgi:hypothetical protein
MPKHSQTYCDGNLIELPSLEEDLLILSCTNNQLRKLPRLPSTLQELKCSMNKLFRLPRLPSTLKRLDCGFNRLKKVPTLPKDMTFLICSYNYITELPDLPDSLTYMNSSDNKLTEVHNLPSNLEFANFSMNKLKTICPLPKNLKRINLDFNYLEELPELSEGLEILSVNNNNLTTLPKLPKSLKELYCCGNKLTELPSLPPNLQILECYDNSIEKLPHDITNCKRLFSVKIDDTVMLTPAQFKLINKYQRFYDDSENVHDSHIQKTFKQCVEQLLEMGRTDDLLNDIKKDKRLSDQAKEMITSFCQHENMISSVSMTYRTLLSLVWSVIKEDNNVIAILNKELTEIDKYICLVGMATTTVNCLSGIYVNMYVSENQYISDFIIHQREKITDEEELREYCFHELIKRGHSPKLVREFVDAI